MQFTSCEMMEDTSACMSYFLFTVLMRNLCELGEGCHVANLFC